MSGHYTPKINGDNSAWGLCVFPIKNHYFCSTSDGNFYIFYVNLLDGTLRIYNSKKKKMELCYRYYQSALNINLDLL
jgi:hypothetical protein